MSDPIIGGHFQIFLRRRQLQANYPPVTGTFQNVIVQCDPLTGAAQYLPGTVDNVTPFPVDSTPAPPTITPVDSWYDFSNYIEGEEKLDFTWDKVNQGDSQAVNKDGSNYDKGITSDLVFRDAAYRFIYQWLLATECQILNFVEVKIIDLISRGNGGTAADPAGNYRIFEIKSDNIDYAPIDEPCKFRIKLREQDEIWHCIHKTVIWDNWQNWFGGTTVPTTKEFPCFFTCIEPRPRLLSSARLALALFWESFIDTIPFFQAVVWFLTKEGLIQHARRVLNADKFVDAPQVYTYIQNVAGRCDMGIDTIFDPGQDWENLCIYFPSAGQMKELDKTATDIVSPDLLFNYDNRWLVTLADLLDKLKIVFCAEWYVTPNNTIVFKYIKDLIQLTPIYDYTAVGAEPIYGLKYTFNGDKKPAYGRYEYQDDGSDLASQEMDTLYNDIVNYDASGFNPMLEGDKTKSFEFACTGFVGDGRSKNYLKLLINDAEIGALILMIIVAIVTAALVGNIAALGIPVGTIAITALTVAWLAEILVNRNKLRSEFVTSPKYKGAVRLTCEQVMTPRLLLWDGISQQKAMTDARIGLPVPEPYFNPTSIPYDIANQVGIDNGTTESPFGLYNYPLYFDSMYYGNLYGRFHDMIDNPLKSIETHQQGRFYVDLCPGQLNLYGVFQNQYAQIGKIVKIEHRDGYDVYIRIGNINVDYGTNQIVITGNVIRKPAASVDDLNPGNIPVVTPEGSVPVETPTGICYKWKNYGADPMIVTYRDCNGEILTDQIIHTNHRFCALEVFSADPGTLAVTDTCASGSESEPGSGTAITPPPGCTKVYKANITQTGTDDPVVFVFENTIGDIVWTYEGVGVYFGTLAGAFPDDTPLGIGTWVQLNNPYIEAESVPIGLIEIRATRPNTDTIVVVQRNASPDDANVDGVTTSSIEIYTYNCERPSQVCADLGIDGYNFTEGYAGLSYHSNINPINADPITFTWITQPDWIQFLSEPNGDGTTFGQFTSILDGGVAPDAGTYDVSFDINGCTITTTVVVLPLPPFIIYFQADYGSSTFVNYTVGVKLFMLSAGQSGVIDWGDSTIEPFTITGTSQKFLHTFGSSCAGCPVNIYLDDDQVFTIDTISPYTDDNSVLWGVRFFYTNTTPNAVYLMNVIGSLDDICGFSLDQPSLIELENIVSPPATFSFGGIFTLANCSIFDGNIQTAPVSWVNAVLVALDANGLTGGSVTLVQATTPAAPTGAGITAKASLIVKGWTVTTD